MPDEAKWKGLWRPPSTGEKLFAKVSSHPPQKYGCVLDARLPCIIITHQQRSNGDRHMYALRTRFIPDVITDRFAECAWPAPTRESTSPAAAPLKSVPIGARLKQMWR